MQVQRLVDSGSDTAKRDDSGNTALLCAAENEQMSTVEYLAERSPWHSVNKAGRTFLDTLFRLKNMTPRDMEIREEVELLAREVRTECLQYVNKEIQLISKFSLLITPVMDIIALQLTG